MSRAALAPSSFLFVAAKPGGGRKMGMAQARSERALAETLRQDRMVLLRTWKLPGWATAAKELSLKDHAEMNEQLTQLLSRGVPLVEALEVTASVISSANKPRVERMRELVASGSSFADACRQVGSFDAVTIAVYKASERTGDLAGAAEQLARDARRRVRLAEKAKSLMIYPIIVLVITLAAASALLTIVVPMIGAALREAQLDLPIYTEVVVGMGDFLRSNILMVGAVAVVLVVLIVLGREVIKQWLTRVLRRAPMFKGLVLAQEQARFFSVMAAMSRAAIPLADALGTASGAIGHPVLRKDLERLRQNLIEGGVFRSLVEKVEALPLATRKLLIAADQAGDLETAFDSLARDMADDVDRKTERALAALEPLLIVFMFVIVGSLLLAIMTPMLTLSGNAM